MKLAVSVGFEPTSPIKRKHLSRVPTSTTHTTHQCWCVLLSSTLARLQTGLSSFNGALHRYFVAPSSSLASDGHGGFPPTSFGPHRARTGSYPGCTNRSGDGFEAMSSISTELFVSLRSASYRPALPRVVIGLPAFFPVFSFAKGPHKALVRWPGYFATK